MEIKPITCNYKITDQFELDFTASIIYKNIVLGNKRYIVLYDENNREGYLKVSDSVHFECSKDISKKKIGDKILSSYTYTGSHQTISVQDGDKELLLMIIDRKLMQRTWHAADISERPLRS